MVLFNHATREMTAKIVYYGPGLCGKTTNLLVIYDNLDSKSKGKMLSLATRSDRTLFFDLLPVDLGKVGNFRLKIQLYTVPGQVFYNETRKLVLRGADAVVFVVDSQPSMLESNRDSFANLFENLRENRIDAEDLPIVIQYNKRDIPGVLPVRNLEKSLGLDGYTSLEASALKGDGVMETFRLVSKITARKLLDRMERRPMESLMDQESERRKLSDPPADSGRNLADIAPAAMGPDPMSVEHPPFEEDYDGMEEVSLEQLLEGRDRPATIGTAQPAADEDDVDELTDADLIAQAPTTEIESGSPAVEPAEPASGDELKGDDGQDQGPAAAETDVNAEAEILALRTQIAELRAEYDELVQTVADLASQLAAVAVKKRP